MPTLTLTGDFNFITKAMQKINGAENALFKPDSASLNQLIDADRLSFTSGFRGDFDYTDNSGTITEIKMTLLDLGTRDYLIRVEFDGFSTPFSDIFNVGATSFTYTDSGWLPVVVPGDYVINASDKDDRLAPVGAFTFAGNDVVTGQAGKDYLATGAGNDRISGGDGRDTLIGQAGRDVLLGDAGNDRLFGGLGNDRLNGGTGHDRLFGANGADILTGGAGRDRLDGGKGKDMLTGGKGADVFVFGPDKRLDTITDFKIGIDRIDVRTATNFADLRLIDKGDDTLVRDGNYKVLLQGINTDDLGASDFLF